MSELASKKCVPCKTGSPPLTGEELRKFYLELGNNWALIGERHIEKIYAFANFKEGLSFVNMLGKIAEEEGHHPDIELSWGRVKVLYCTHKIKGLSESDFVMAAKTDVCFLSYLK